MRVLKGGPESQSTQMRKRFSLDTRDPLVDELIHERYKIEGKVGSGGMGNVYLAFDQDKSEYVALKMIGDGVEPGSDVEKRLELEAKAAMTINHENVVDILDIGRVGNKLFLVMEFLEGRDLKAEIINSGRMEWVQVRHVIEKVCDALDAAHGYEEKGVAMPILHRDIKPENIFLISNGELPHVKLIDFGLAKITNENKGGENKRELTNIGTAVGSPSYMAPEKLTVRKYDHRADLYSLGITIYEMLTGRPPFTSDAENWDVQVLLKHINEEPRRLTEVRPDLVLPKGVEDAIMKSLEKDPSKRHQSAREMKEAILGKDSVSRVAVRVEPPRSSKRPPAREATMEIIDFEELPATEIPEQVSRTIPEPIEPLADPDKMEYIPTGRSGSGIGKALKNITIAGIIAAAAYFGYTNRQKIGEFFEQQPPQQSSSVQNPPAPTVQAAPTTFQLRVQSEPGGASVYDITEGRRSRAYLGSTPLNVYLQRGQRTILIVGRGYAETTLAVSPEAPTHSVRLRRQRPRAEPTAEPEPREEEISEPPPEQPAP